MKINLLFPFLASLLATPTLAQPASSAYKTLLNTLYGNSTVPTVTVVDLKKMTNVVLLDTREKKEFDVSHLPNARWIGYDDFALDRVKGIPKTANVVTYCSVGYRSDKIGDKLQAAGYGNVHNLYGSLFEWVNQGNPVVDSLGKPTNRVHAFSRPWGIWLKKGEKVYE